MSEPAFISAAEAAELLGVKVGTLYAYVSRGQVESVAAPAGRARLYRRHDIQRLKARRDGKATSPDLGTALRWGEPVLDSSITQVLPQGPQYRGHDAVELARAGKGFEAVAELLWTGDLPAEAPRWPRVGPAAALEEAAVKVAGLLPPGRAPSLAALAVLVPAIAVNDPGRFDRAPAAVLTRARGLVRSMAELLGASADLERGLAECLLEGCCGKRGSAAALDLLLVLWADHELNVSSFAARVAASAGADVYSCLSAGIAALSGPRHGGACEQIYALLDEIKQPARAEEVLNERARRDEAVPGFGHPLYPAGDPRALPLLEAARELGARSPRVQICDALIEAQARRHLAPTIDVGTVALCEALRLPPELTLGLIAIGRCAGWVAHVLEQYESDFLIRPRARYRAELRRSAPR
ncbi:MAG: citrate synthase [Planctomycetota bacterium]